MNVYNSTSPPTVPLEKIKVPVALFVASDDRIADVMDNERLMDIIPSVVQYTVLADEDHMSLGFSKNMLYFTEVIDLIKKY